MERSTSSSSLCLATVTTAEYIPGTLVLLQSFLKHNPWFQGDLVIIHDHLPPWDQDRFVQTFPRVRFLQVEPVFKQLLADLFTHRPDLRQREARFFSLEVLRLRGYRKVLFCDGDLLFRGSIQELFERVEPLVCCGDGTFFRGAGRDARSYAEVKSDIEPDGTILCKTFNAGVLLFDAGLLMDAHRAGLLNLLEPERWKHIQAAHTDQIVFNLYFAGQQHLVSNTYNYLLCHRALIEERTQIGLTRASVLHFCGPDKPWLLTRALNTSMRDAGYIKALEYWYDAYTESLFRMHRRSTLAHSTSVLDTGQSETSE